MGNANPRNGQFDSSTWLPPRLFSENKVNGKSCQKNCRGGVVKARKPSDMVEQEKEKNWLRWLLAEEMVAKIENGLAELAVEVLRQMVKKKNERVDKTG